MRSGKASWYRRILIPGILASVFCGGVSQAAYADPGSQSSKEQAAEDSAADSTAVSESSGDELRDAIRDRLYGMDIADPDPEVQREFEVLKQMEAQDPSSAGDSLDELESTTEYEFHGFSEEETEGTEESSPLDSEPVFSEYDLSECSFSMKAGAYCYTLKNGEQIYMSVPAGAVADGPVDITFSSDDLGIYAIEKDGESDYNILSREFKDEGEYLLKLYWIDSAASEGEIGFQIPVSFQISGPVESERRAVHAPTGFRFRSVSVDGKEEEVPDRVLIPETDGTYEIVFEAVKNPDVTYSYTVQVDTTAPELRFSQDLDGKIRVPVSFEKLEADSDVKIYLNYREAVFENDTLTRGGNYRIVVTDPAGNSRTYSFQAAEDNRKKIAMGAAGGVLFLIALFIYMKYIREHMSVL